MDYGKAKIILKKLSTLIDSFESMGEPISEIESEMLHKYVEKLGQLIPFESETVQSISQIKHAPTERKRDSVATPETKSIQGESSHSDEKAVETKKAKKVEPPKQVKVEKVEVPELIEEEIEMELVEEPILKAAPKKEVVVEKAKKKTVLVSTEDDDADGDTSDLWAPVEIKELSHKLSFSPIKNIFKAISINERILTQNELFDGDSKAFKKTLDHLETFTNFEDAANYLRRGVAKEHNWEEGKKIKKANNFMKIVQRRFL